MVVAIKNLKKVKVKVGIKGTESFPAMKAPDQKNADKTISKYIFLFDKITTPCDEA